MAGYVELELCPCGGPHSWLVPAMLSPPESLLMSCIRRGNFMQAHQVSINLPNNLCSQHFHNAKEWRCCYSDVQSVNQSICTPRICQVFFDHLQVSLVFDLEKAPCFGELVFMERYKEVLVELGQVEQKMESQSMSSSSSSSEGLGMTAVPGAGRSRLGSSGRSTLQAIGSAAAAGFTSF